MFFRTITLAKGRKISAYGLFSSFPEMFSALLEDPSGKGRQFLASRDGHSHSLAWNADQEAASDFLRQWKARLKDDPADSPAIRCLFYAAYEAGNFIERLPDPKTHAPGPVLWTFYPHYSLCIDAENSMLHLAAGDEAQLEVLAGMVEKASGLTDEAAAFPFSANRVSVGSADGYKNAVRRVKAYIAAGDIFQANIARFWDSEFADEDLPALYAELRRVNPAPFSAYARIKSASGLLHILSASPERLFRISSDGHVDTRPIAGTRRRGEGEADQALSAELLLSGKERAEHIMLVDLERNDMGRVCRPGSVKVDEHMVIERYATVQHIVSNVCGDLAEGRDAVDVFRAMFPGGTITGCPKIRCMEIIHELEDGARGPYTGGLGYMAWDGSADMNILIRTFWHFDGRLHLAAGAGIVADSSPEFELKETEHKAEGLFMALSGGRGADARALKI